VGIMSRTRFEWTVIDFAIWYAGAISVPVYETNAPAQAAWALSHSEATAVFVEDEKLLGRIKEAEELSASAEEPMQLKHRWVIENETQPGNAVADGSDIFAPAHQHNQAIDILLFYFAHY